jgi:4-hydroxy-tetrahydrodipicolinate reductase
MTRVIITGAKGRMGQALIACAPQLRDNIKIVGQVNRRDNLAAIIDSGDVVVDFSSHTTTLGFVELCAKRKKAIVIGTTGHSDIEKSEITKFKSEIVMVWASNFSLGINTLFWLIQEMARVLDVRYDLEILEMHHRWKKDAPSGTAKTFAEKLNAIRKSQLGVDLVGRYGRAGIVGERQPQEIGVHSIRGGDTVGDHTIIFAGNDERIEVTHRASSRAAFAHGALHAAIWAADQQADGKPGLYDMQDVLRLKKM